MMNSVILCEGSTDYTLLQYYMRKVHGWEDAPSMQKGIFRVQGQQKSRILKRDNGDFLTIASAGGCSQLPAGVRAAVKRIRLAQNDGERFDRVVVITDRDEELSEDFFIKETGRVFEKENVAHTVPIENNCWNTCSMINSVGLEITFEFLMLMVPFEENGAMETFLLNAVANDSEYDKGIIEKCNYFVEQIDPEKRYLHNRRYITKAKFDTYFSVRTPVTQFEERQNILKNVEWEKYELIREDFKRLADL